MPWCAISITPRMLLFKLDFPLSAITIGSKAKLTFLLVAPQEPAVAPQEPAVAPSQDPAVAPPQDPVDYPLVAPPQETGDKPSRMQE